MPREDVASRLGEGSRFSFALQRESLDGIVVSNPDADHIGGFLDVFDAFEVASVYVSGDPKGTLTYNSFLRGVRDEGSRVQMVRSGYRMNWGGVQADV